MCASPVMSNEFSVVSRVAQFDTVNADCITIRRIARMTSDISNSPVHQYIHYHFRYLISINLSL